jgi:hypothetical protein
MRFYRKGFIDDKTREKMAKEEVKIREAAKELERREKTAGGYVLAVCLAIETPILV